MPSAQTWIAFLVTTIGFSLMPGPNVAFLVTRSVQHGPLAAWRSALGVELSNVIFAALTAAGLAQVIAANSTAFTIIKWAGICYLCWLGIQALRHARDIPMLTAASPVEGWMSQLLRGLLSGITNPKVAVFFVAFLPQFVRSNTPAAPQLLAFGLAFALCGLVIDTAWCLAAGVISRRFRGRPRTWQNLGRVSALSYFGLAGWAAVSNHRPAQ